MRQALSTSQHTSENTLRQGKEEGVAPRGARADLATHQTNEKGRASASTHRPAARASRSRTLHLGHFAFMRSVVQGLDTRGSWERYLRLEGEHDDIRHVRRTIQWIRDEFAAAAKRHDRFGTARLVRMDASRIADKATAIPTLEEFAVEYDLLDFSEAEQLEAYHERFGARTSNESRRARLIAKQLDALAWLESLHTQTHPRATDAIASWLHPDLADRLEVAGIETLSDLVDRINGLGMRWWAGIRAIGSTKSQRIMDWLRANESSIGLALGVHVDAKRSSLSPEHLMSVVAPATAVVPLEKLVLPPALNGGHGYNRVPQYLCRIPASNDIEAVLAWIDAKKDSSSEGAVDQRQNHRDNPPSPVSSKRTDVLSHTQRAYRKEGERFLLWSIVQQAKPLSSITEGDCYTYLAFLASPSPAQRWCGPRSRERWSPLWRPFEGPLSAGAQRQAVTILKNLFSFLVEHRYLATNPWKTVALPMKGHKHDSPMAQGIQESSIVERQMDRLPDSSVGRRTRFVMNLISATGLRISDLVHIRVDDLMTPQHRETAGNRGAGLDKRWRFAVAGKGSEHRVIPLDSNIIDELSHYLVSRGLEPDPLHPANSGAYLIGKASDVVERVPWAPLHVQMFDAKAGISAGVIARDLRRYVNASAAEIRRAKHGGWS